MFVRVPECTDFLIRGNIAHPCSLGDGVTFPQRCLDEDSQQLLASNQRWSDTESPPPQRHQVTGKNRNLLPHLLASKTSFV